MRYTIAEVAQRTGLTAHTLRYYDKEGLLPFVERDSAGNRSFKDSDISWIYTIGCMKKTGMPLKMIRQYVEWGMEGADTIPQRLEMMLEHKKKVELQMEEIQKVMDKVNSKIDYYQSALAKKEHVEVATATSIAL